MDSRSRSIERRAWIVVGATFVALLLPIPFNALGFADYRPEQTITCRAADRGLGNRICLISEAMIPACFIVFAVAQFRVRCGALFEGEDNGGRIMPAFCGVCGLALFVNQWAHWGPYTGEPFATLLEWPFVVAWLLLWWCFVFVQIGPRHRGQRFRR
mgnify:CR=1 FL=1